MSPARPIRESPAAPARLLQIIGSLDPAEGGPVELLVQLHATLDQAGIEMEAVTLDPPGAPFLNTYPFPVHALGETAEGARRASMRWPWDRYRYAPRYPKWLDSNLARFSATIVHGLWSYHSLGASAPLRRSGKPYLCFTHGVLDPWFRRAHPLKHLVKQLVWWAGDGPLLNGARHVLFIAEEERTLARGAFLPYCVNERVIRFGIAAPPPVHPVQTKAFARAVPALSGRRYLLYLSRINPKKGCDLLIEAFSDLANSDPDMDLVIAGPDNADWTAALVRLAERTGVAGRVHWPGMLRGDAKWGAFHGCEAFVLPSHQENFGIVVAEALGCGKPVLISNKVNIWREIEAHGAGIVADDTLAGARRLLQDWASQPPEQRNAQARAARACFDACFDIETTSADILALVQEVLGA